MSTRTLSHGQFEELRRYEDGRGHYLFRAPSRSLTRNGYLSVIPNSGHDRASSAFRITGAGIAALILYYERYGIRYAALSPPPVASGTEGEDG